MSSNSPVKLRPVTIEQLIDFLGVRYKRPPLIPERAIAKRCCDSEATLKESAQIAVSPEGKPVKTCSDGKLCIRDENFRVGISQTFKLEILLILIR